MIRHQSKNRARFVANISLVLVALFWGSSFVVIKNSLDDVDPVTLVAYRFLLSASVIALFLLFKRKKMFSNFKQGFVLGLILLLLYIPQTVGLRFTSALNSGFIMGMLVIFIPFLAFAFWREVPSLANLLSVFSAIVGLWFLTEGIKELNPGDLLTLIAAFAGALHILITDKYVKGKYDPMVLHFQQMLTVGFVSLLCVLILRIPLSVSSFSAVNSIIYLTVTSSIFGYGIQMFAQKHTSPITVSLIFTLEPVFAAMFAWTIGGEEFQMLKGLGGGIIFISMLMQVFFGERLKGKPESKKEPEE